MKRIFALLVAIMVIATLVPVASAETQLELEQAIIQAMYSGENADLSSYDIDTDDLAETYSMLYQTGRLPWFADQSCAWVADQDGNVVEFDPKSLDEWGYDEDLYEQKLAEMIYAACNEGMSDWQKALAIHDHMATHIVYDQTMQRNSAYEALIDGTTACEGYSQLFMDAMRRLDIPCQIANCKDTGDGIGHAWNLVQIDGDWYHVDVTWDDATPDIYGRVLHTHFLRTDDQFSSKENGHNFGWTAFAECNGKKYSKDMPWEGVESAIAFDDDNTMYIHRSVEGAAQISKVVSGSMEAETIYTGSQIIVNLGEGDCYFPAMGLTLWNDRLYFTTSTAVLSIDKNGDNEIAEFNYDVAPKKSVILGSFLDSGSMRITLANIDMVTEPMTQPVSEGEYHIHSYSQVGTAEPRCDADGGTVYECECGVSFIGGKIPALPHSLQESEEDGRTVYSCVNCDYSFYEADMHKQGSAGGSFWLWVVIIVVVVIFAILIFKPKKRKY